MTDTRLCESCSKTISVRKDGLLRVHFLDTGEPCPGGAQPEAKGIEQKARQYLAEGRVKVVRVTPGDCEVEVHGSQPEPYRVKLVGESWTCPCEARTWRCAHVVAAGMVVPDDMAVPGFGDAQPAAALDDLLVVPVDADDMAAHID